MRSILEHGYPVDGAEDHGATISAYLRDPDGNGLELHYDRPKEEWFDAQGVPILKAEALVPRELLDEQV